MICYQGEEVWPADNGSPTLYSIGAALGRIPRFCGHTRDYYPVLGHVLTVAALMPVQFSIYGLLHDSPEACVSDVPTPWKTEGAKEQEAILLERIYKAQGLKWPIPPEAQDAVDVADRICLYAEAHAIGHPATQPNWTGRKDDWPKEYDTDAYDLTLYHLSNAPKYLHPEISGPIFEQAFEYYCDPGLLVEEREQVEA